MVESSATPPPIGTPEYDEWQKDETVISNEQLGKLTAGFEAYNQIVKQNLIEEKEIIEERQTRARAPKHSSTQTQSNCV